ncbi:MAG: DUF4432 family protein [Acidobacteria bacterium]|nr:DUF4432 family protein [Acidobacteriota bacterium]
MMSTYPQHVHDRNYGCRLTESILKGYRAVTFENEKIRVTVLADKGTDVCEFLYKPQDTDFLWRSSLGLRERGSYHPMAPVPGGDFFDYYEGGWQEMFPWGGLASTHRGVNTGLHGEVALAPWDYQIDTNTPEEVAVTFSIRTRRAPFLLKKTLTIRRNQAALYIRETATNESGQEIEIVWGHHPAYGWPFLDETCVVNLPPCEIKITAPLDSTSRLAPNQETAWPKAKLLDGGTVDLSKIAAPSSRSQDLAFLHGFKEGWYALRNPSRGVGVGFAWDAKVFSYLWFWQLYGGGPDYPWWGREYVAALEPVTSMATRFSDAIENGTAFQFAGKSSVTTEMTVWAFEATGPVRRVTTSGVEL